MLSDEKKEEKKYQQDVTFVVFSNFTNEKMKLR
jgi:hypothetical protein